MPVENDFGQQVGDELPGWTPRERPRPTTLRGRHVTVESLSASHIEALYDALCGPDDRDLWTYRPTEAPEDVPEMARLVASAASSTENLTFALVPTTGPLAGTAQGMASYYRIDESTGQIEVAAVILGHRLQRTTAATEAIHLMMAHAFDDLGYRRFEWKCDSLNEPSRQAAKRLGFTYEGRFRHHMITKGRNRDTDWFSVTDAEWPAVRAAHERWLDPANFDVDGRQLSRLEAAGP